MKRILVDANVLSEATKSGPNPAVVAWLRRNERLLAVDPVILGEIRFGILLLQMGRRRATLENWFEQVVRRIECLAWDARTGGRWAELLAQMRLAGTTMAVRDSLIAATALTHSLTLATRNIDDFTACGVNLVNPFRTPDQQS
ncbi:MAG: type II toxin-antitoxin system VapC family toxin [Spirochaetaceae bacterium]|nr:type II toxin-antitoxin system VapC family toxin [Spirochaetaceae bacterium]MDE0227366.1 type II toxin-antitoxin system VapC family toxin [Spirochaetaceae bacterium]